MKLVKQSATLLKKPEPTDHDGVLKYLEEIGRVCYKSEDKITDDSAPKFIEILRERKHWAMLEHYIFTITVPASTFAVLRYFIEHTSPDYSLIANKGKYINLTTCKDSHGEDIYYVSGSATSFNYFFEEYINIKRSNDIVIHTAMMELNAWLHDKYPELFNLIPNATLGKEEIRFVSNQEVANLPNMARLIHDWASFRFITNRGISHQIVRHRPASYAQASTRYCNYASGKFDGEITFIEPHFSYDKELYETWTKSMEESESAYMQMIKHGASPQLAREVLPNSLATELTMTANLLEWLHFFELRCSVTSHPEMQMLSKAALFFFNEEFGLITKILC